jgi:hypothetical protein
VSSGIAAVIVMEAMAERDNCLGRPESMNFHSMVIRGCTTSLKAPLVPYIEWFTYHTPAQYTYYRAHRKHEQLHATNQIYKNKEFLLNKLNDE